MFCKKCGNYLSEDARFCPTCGTATGNEDSAPYRYAAPGKEKKQDGSYRYVPPKKEAEEDTSYRYVPPRKRSQQEDTSYRYVPPKKEAQEDTSYRYVPSKKEEPEEDTSYRYVPPKEPAAEDPDVYTPPAGRGRPWEAAGKTKHNDQEQKKGAKKFLKWVAYIAIFGFCFAVWVSSLEDGQSTDAAKQSTESMTVQEYDYEQAWKEERAARLPNVPADLQDHFLLQSRDLGACAKLRGDVELLVVLADDSESSWSQPEINDYMAEIQKDVQQLVSDARSWGVDLNVVIDSRHVAIEGDATSAAANGYTGPILTELGMTFYDLKGPLVIAYNKNGRAHAYRGMWECCLMFKDEDGFRHELFHLYGAEDFYYHDDMVSMVKTWLGDSIMLTSRCYEVDDLTAYLIGWTDTLSQDALGFLRATSAISQTSLAEAGTENSFSGMGTREYDNGAVYTGYMINGMPQGWGTYTFSNGDVYEGHYDDGQWAGTGTYYWADGSVYEGEFKDGKFHGTGTLTYYTGHVQSGRWENGEYMGK